MSKETDAIKIKAKMLGYMGVAYFICALYLGLTSFAMHGTLEEIENGVYSFAICGVVAIFGMIAYLIINKNILKREEEEGCNNAHE